LRSRSVSPGLPDANSDSDRLQHLGSRILFHGGCSATTVTNIATIASLPANVECVGANLSFTYTVSDNCTTQSCTSTFTVPAAVPIAVTCAPAQSLPACQTLTQIQTAYNTWVAGFSFTGGCSATTVTNIATIASLPANVECVGANLSFTYTVSDNCTTQSCTSTFTVPAAVPIAVTCAPAQSLPACQTLTQIQTAYNTWVAGFSFTGGCSATTVTNIATIASLPANVECVGANLSFTYTVSDNCTTQSCTSTFTVRLPFRLPSLALPLSLSRLARPNSDSDRLQHLGSRILFHRRMLRYYSN